MKRFFAILIHPRATMRTILDQGKDSAVVPLVLLATLSAFLRNAEIRGARAAEVPLWLHIVIPICTALIALGLFFVFAWVATVIGRRLFEGTGDVRSVRSALAWGMAPVILALVYRIPVAFLMPETTRRVRISEHLVISNTDRLAHGCGVAVVFFILELGVLTWLLFVSSNTLAEAHRFSGWRGLGTLLTTMFVPVLVVIAAVLASST